MAENLDRWPSKRRPISNIGPSDGCGWDADPLAVEPRYNFLEFEGYPGNIVLVFQIRYLIPSNPAVVLSHVAEEGTECLIQNTGIVRRKTLRPSRRELVWYDARTVV